MEEYLDEDDQHIMKKYWLLGLFNKPFTIFCVYRLVYMKLFHSEIGLNCLSDPS